MLKPKNTLDKFTIVILSHDGKGGTYDSGACESYTEAVRSRLNGVTTGFATVTAPNFELSFVIDEGVPTPMSWGGYLPGWTPEYKHMVSKANPYPCDAWNIPGGKPPRAK